MNKANEIIGVKKMPKYQMLKAKMLQKVKHVLTVSMVLGTVIIGNASATVNNSTTDFSDVTDTIEAVIPLFGALQDLLVAILPYLVVLTAVIAMTAAFRLFTSDLDFK